MNNIRWPEQIESIVVVSVFLGLVAGLFRRSKRGLLAMLSTFVTAPLIGIAGGFIADGFDLSLGWILAATAFATLLGEQLILFALETADRAAKDPAGAWQWIRANIRLPGIRPPNPTPPSPPAPPPGDPDEPTGPPSSPG
ncbi:hypothetical protein [Hyphobacterium sp.]|uniref:hypothetical protein n=1 Tax=Hyphobacterium sp. TaxID=2004662 RepID=UPI003BAC7FD7